MGLARADSGSVKEMREREGMVVEGVKLIVRLPLVIPQDVDGGRPTRAVRGLQGPST